MSILIHFDTDTKMSHIIIVLLYSLNVGDCDLDLIKCISFLFNSVARAQVKFLICIASLQGFFSLLLYYLISWGVCHIESDINYLFVYQVYSSKNSYNNILFNYIIIIWNDFLPHQVALQNLLSKILQVMLWKSFQQTHEFAFRESFPPSIHFAVIKKKIISWYMVRWIYIMCVNTLNAVWLGWVLK